MEWRGGARWLLSANMLYLAGVILLQLIREPDPKRWPKIGKWALWLTLLPVPFVMYLGANPALFPPVNPDSGGATGGSLLVSSLGAITIMWLTPFLLSLSHRVTRKQVITYLLIQGAHYGFFFTLDHGDQSHYLISQILSLVSLGIWIPLLVYHFRKFEWPQASRTWLWSFALWGAFLVLSANIMFAPGLLDKWKFTNFLVGHTHAAMAGMLSSFNLLVLITLNRNSALAQSLGRKTLFWTWNLGVALHVAILKIFGMIEGNHPDWLTTRPDVVNIAYSLRFLSGLLMFVVGAMWLLGCLQAEAEKAND
jgi:cytochrome c oxidase cbb3-type subunit 1